METDNLKPPKWDGLYRCYSRDQNGKLVLLGEFATEVEAEAAAAVFDANVSQVTE